MKNSVEDITNRLRPLAKLSSKSRIIFEKHNFVEKLLEPSPYLPSLALEAEFAVDRYKNYLMPYDQFQRAMNFGIREGRDGNTDNFIKSELDLEPTSGTHLVHAHEIDTLVNMGIFRLKQRRRNYRTEFYPIHINLGIPADLPNWNGNNGPYEYIERDDWTELRYAEGAPIVREVIGYSDSFLLARMFDATGWATSSDRILMPYQVYDELGKVVGFKNQGFSGVRGRSDSKTWLAEKVTEIRTCEIWGQKSLKDFQKYLKTIQHVGAMLKSYEKMPLKLRDKILQAELKGDTESPLEIIMGYEGFDLDQDANLAYMWHELRHKTMELFDEQRLPNPMNEYNKREFTIFAKQLPTIGSRKPRMKLLKGMRTLLTEYRGKVAKVIN